MGRSLSEIQTLWPTLDDHTLTRMSGVAAAPAEVAGTAPALEVQGPVPVRGAAAALELRVELAPQVVLVLAVTDERIAISPADVHAVRDAAAPLLAELASRRLYRTSTPAHPRDLRALPRRWPVNAAIAPSDAATPVAGSGRVAFVAQGW